MKYLDTLIGVVVLLVLGFLGYQVVTWNSSRIVSNSNAAALESSERMAENVGKATVGSNIKRAETASVVAANRAIVVQSVSEYARMQQSNTRTGDSCAAERKTIATQGIILQECTARLVEMAEYADDHAIDSELLRSAWPSN